MKEIKAVIQPFKLDDVLHALHELGNLPSMVISEASAVDTQHDLYDRVTKMKIELMVPDSMAEAVVIAIQRAAHTGNPGDGRIFVVPIEDSILIRNGERGEGAR